MADFSYNLYALFYRFIAQWQQGYLYLIGDTPSVTAFGRDSSPYGGAFPYGKACAFWLLQTDYSEDFQFVIRLSADYLNIVAAGGYL